ncbi:hypothetical protein EsH8_IX_001070 [Colletotrichum jinshuiense]
MGVDFTHPNHEWWLRPSDGFLVPLVLQSVEEPRILVESSRWSRLGPITSRVSPLLRASYWVGSSMFIPGTRTYNLRIRPILLTALKLIAAWPIFCILVCWTGNMNSIMGRLSYHPAFIDSRYDAVRVPQATDKDLSSDRHQSASGQDHGEGAASTGPVDPVSSEQQYTSNIRLSETLPSTRPRRSDSSPISLRPRYLCFVKDFDKMTYETVKVSEYLEQYGDDTDLEFVFVSYTRMQFRVATEEEINKHQYPNEATREANRKTARQDRQTLARWGIDAAKRVGKRAFWLDFECVRNDDGVARSSSSSKDVYRICDIVRAAHSMIIAIGPPASDKVAALLGSGDCKIVEYRREQVTPWLRQWGSRLWTLPELLLCPSEYRIKLYVLGDPLEPKAIAKRNFAERAWDDAEAVKELVNHFEGSAILTDLRLIEAALACFSRRQTDQFSQGDIAYATMGLFPNRHRPRVDKEDTGFQAFAKLSLVNDSGAFLSRLICLAPRQGAPWHQIEDRWGVELSDVYPSCKVSGVAGAESIVLDEVYAATIHWDKIYAEPLLDQNSNLAFSYFFLVVCVFCIMFPLALIFITYLESMIRTYARHPSPRLGTNVFLTLYFWTLPMIGLMALLVPVVLMASRCHSKRTMKPRLIGIEGIVNASKIAKHLWGFDHGDLTTVVHQPFTDTEGPGPSPALPRSSPPKHGEEYSFTLVDTNLMTVSHFYSSQAPVAMFVCGSEGGAQRSLLCSYDWRSRTFHRQAVFRVMRHGLDQFHLLNGVRLSLASHPSVNSDASENDVNPQPSSPTSRNPQEAQPSHVANQYAPPKNAYRTWKTEVLFVAICIVGLNTVGSSNNTVDYSIYFIPGLLSGLLVLLYMPLNQATMYTFAGSVVLGVLGDASSEKAFHGGIIVAQDFVKGFLALTLIKCMICWYPVNELPVRFLLWNVVATKLLDTLGLGFARGMLFVLQIIALCVLWMTDFMDLIGGPKDVSWLSPHQMLYYSNQAAASDFGTSIGDATRRNRQQQVIGLLRPLLVFFLSLLASINHQDSYTNQDVPGDVSDAGIAFAAVIFGLVCYIFPSKSFQVIVAYSMMSSTSSLLATFIPRSQPVPLLLFIQRLNELIPPLLWATAVRQTHTWAEALGTISMSWIAVEVGQIILLATSDKIPTLVVQLPLFLGQIIIWALLWACGRTTGGIRLPDDI